MLINYRREWKIVLFHFAAGVSSIPIVDENGSLVDVYARRFALILL